jgi:hypothetical protein
LSFAKGGASGFGSTRRGGRSHRPAPPAHGHALFANSGRMAYMRSCAQDGHRPPGPAPTLASPPSFWSWADRAGEQPMRVFTAADGLAPIRSAPWPVPRPPLGQHHDRPLPLRHCGCNFGTADGLLSADLDDPGGGTGGDLWVGTPRGVARYRERPGARRGAVRGHLSATPQPPP